MTWRLAQADEQRAIEAFLSRHVASSMFLLSNLRDHGLSGTAPKAMKVWLRGAPNNGVAGLTNDGTLLVQAPMATDADWRSMQALVEAQLAGRPQTGVLGATDQLRRYLAATGLAARATRLNRDEPGLALDLGDLDLTCLNRPALADAVLMPISAAPRPMLVQWRAAYHQEVLGTPAAEAVAMASADIDSYLLRDSHRILSVGPKWAAMTGFNAQLPGVVQIGGVYTPPDMRGRGYARAALALHLQQAARKGTEKAVLFAAGDAAVRAYQAIGFRQIEGYSLVLFDPSNATAAKEPST
ncbi:GNAT family N-acetyltransferase [Phaeobacter italicus]|uniref:GNAT family N-acetyltransferase n=1 Tax=Phaeobacter italicus TaxID=481446 RepID=UPI00232AF551|nr:GNAT family N-acetyltransferase [Phaeobacter italicus]